MDGLFDGLNDDEVGLILKTIKLVQIDKEFVEKFREYVNTYLRGNSNLDDEAFEVDEVNRDHLLALTDFFSARAYLFGSSGSDTSAIPHDESGVFKINLDKFVLFKEDVKQFADVIRGSTVVGFLPAGNGKVEVNCCISGVHKLRENENEIGDDLFE